jgi:hypothetical protein
MVEVGPAADEHGLMEVVGATGAGSDGTNDAPTRQSARLYHLFYCGSVGGGRRLASALWGHEDSSAG